MQFLLPSGQVAIGVFQNLMESKYEPGASAWYCLHEPAWRDSICAQALVLTGVSPNERACSAWMSGRLTHWVHRYAQLGWGALVASIHVSPHPVAPSLGMVSATGAPAAFSWIVWYGQAAPMKASPFWNMEISSEADGQYFLISCRCCISNATVASNCFLVSSYGSLMPRLGCDLLRYRAASAIVIAESYAVTRPLLPLS